MTLHSQREQSRNNTPDENTITHSRSPIGGCQLGFKASSTSQVSYFTVMVMRAVFAAKSAFMISTLKLLRGSIVPLVGQSLDLQHQERHHEQTR